MLDLELNYMFRITLEGLTTKNINNYTFNLRVSLILKPYSYSYHDHNIFYNKNNLPSYKRQVHTALYVIIKRLRYAVSLFS